MGSKKQSLTQGASCHGGHLGRNQRKKDCQLLAGQELMGNSGPKSEVHGLPVSTSFTSLEGLWCLLLQPPRKYFVPLLSHLLFGFAALKHQLAYGLVWLEDLLHPPIHLPIHLSIPPYIHPSTYPPIHPSIQKIFINSLLRTRHHSR